MWELLKDIGFQGMRARGLGETLLNKSRWVIHSESPSEQTAITAMTNMLLPWPCPLVLFRQDLANLHTLQLLQETPLELEAWPKCLHKVQKVNRTPGSNSKIKVHS